MSELKKCTKCDLEQPLSFYHPTKQTLSGISNQCKKCVNKVKQESKKRRKLGLPDARVKNAGTLQKCTQCNLHKSVEDFHIYPKNGKPRAECKECHSKRHKLKYLKNKDKILIKNSEWRSQNKERMTELMAKWRFENPDKNAKLVKKQREKDAQDPLKRLAKCLRQRLLYGLQGKTKNLKSLEYLGCSIEELKEHLEKQFTEGMSWENRGIKGWEIDHIVPVSQFDLSNEDDIHKCCHYTNLQPLWKIDNLKKSNKTIEKIS